MYSRIVVPLDGSTFSETALPYARGIAGSLAIPVELVEAFDILPPAAHHRQSAEANRRLLADAERHSRDYLAQVGEELRSDGLVVYATTLPGAPARALVDWLVREPEALVVMSTHGRGGINRLVLGSVTDRVVRHVLANPKCAPRIQLRRSRKSGMPPLGRSEISGCSFTSCRGSSRIVQRWPMVASASMASIHAKPSPMHRRGPPPKG